MKNKRLFVGLAVLIAVLLAACGPKTTRVSVDMTEFKFTPDRIEVPAWGEVELTLNNKGTLEHEYVIMLLGTQATTPFDTDDEPNV